MLAVEVRAGHPRTALGDPVVGEITDPRRGRPLRVGAERLRPDVATHQTRVRRKLGVGEGHGDGRLDLSGQSLLVDLAVTWDADDQRLRAPVGVAQQHDDVLERVVSAPRAVGPGVRLAEEGLALLHI